MMRDIKQFLQLEKKKEFSKNIFKKSAVKKEFLFLFYVLIMSQEERRKRENRIRESFLQLLRETPVINLNSQWKKVIPLIEGDPRYSFIYVVIYSQIY